MSGLELRQWRRETSDCARIDMGVEVEDERSRSNRHGWVGSERSGSRRHGWEVVVDGSGSDMAQMSTRAPEGCCWGAYVDVGALTSTSLQAFPQVCKLVLRVRVSLRVTKLAPILVPFPRCSRQQVCRRQQCRCCRTRDTSGDKLATLPLNARAGC